MTVKEIPGIDPSREIRSFTRRAVSVYNDLVNEFGAVYTRRDIDRQLRKMRNAYGKTYYHGHNRDLQKMLTVCGISFEKGYHEPEYYEELLKDVHFPTYEEISEKMTEAFLKHMGDYMSPADYMKRIVDDLENADDGWRNDTLRLRILKRFVKYGHCLDDMGNVGGKPVIRRYAAAKAGHAIRNNEELFDNLCKYLDDGIFDLLEGADRDQTRLRGTYGLIKMTDDLAKGYFRTGGSTKLSLYLFAIVYNMTYYTGNDEKEDDAQDVRNLILRNELSDIELRLFQEYYHNNLVRYYTEKYRNERANYEADPRGDGINYKNFREMIYIYYISRNDMPILEKLARSHAMIKEVSKAGKAVKGKGPVSLDSYAIRSRFKGIHNGNVNTEDVLALDENSFRDFILTYYDCNAKGQGDMEIAKEQKTAYKVYKEIMTVLEEDYGKTLEDCDYGIQFTELDLLRNRPQDFLSRHPDVTEEQLKDYVGLLESVNRFIVGAHRFFRSNDDIEGQVVLEKGGAIAATGPEDVTRTSIIAAYYYLYNAMNETDEDIKNFEEMCNDFSKGVNEYLEEAYYQPFNVKNILDMMIVFSSFAYLN